MLKDQDAMAIIAVSDMARAHDFYGNTLGLPIVSGDDNVMRYRTGATALVVYRSEFAGTNQSNAVVWGVGSEIETIVSDLKAKGVQFEHYAGMDLRGDVHVAGAFKMAWLKDPDGNILHLNNM